MPIRKIAPIITIIVIAVLAVGITAVQQDDPFEEADVAVTIPPQAEHVEELSDDLEVLVMIPPGEDPHHYEPEPERLQRLGTVDAYYKLGSGMEFEAEHMETLKEQNPEMEIIDSSEGIELIDIEHDHDHNDHEDDHNHNDHDHDHEEGKDPHIWMSPNNTMTMINNLKEGLVEEFPNKEEIQNNADDYLNEWEELHGEIENDLKPHENKTFMIYHPSMGYFAQDYNLNQMAIEIGGEEPGTQDLQNLIDRAKEENISTVFVSPQFPKEDAETIATEIDGEVQQINPLEKEHLSNLTEISQTLSDSL